MDLLSKSCSACFVFLAIGCAPKPVENRDDQSVVMPAIKVEARGSGRAWQFSYSGPDGIIGSNDDVVCSGKLLLPEGSAVTVHLRSNDYIYVFSCPQLDLKEIAVPDLEFAIDFRADQGKYDLVMDPMCGFWLPPDETMGAIEVVSGVDFQSWLDGARD